MLKWNSDHIWWNFGYDGHWANLMHFNVKGGNPISCSIALRRYKYVHFNFTTLKYYRLWSTFKMTLSAAGIDLVPAEYSGLNARWVITLWPSDTIMHQWSLSLCVWQYFVECSVQSCHLHQSIHQNNVHSTNMPVIRGHIAQLHTLEMKNPFLL